jgi:ubiquinone biosynthesis monooxygenase Coq7
MNFSSSPRNLSHFDHWLVSFDRGLKAILHPTAPGRENPAGDIPDWRLNALERKKAAALMRIDHTGEICAQALYQGQALTTREKQTCTILLQSAQEEVDHLLWCRERLRELRSHPSYLDPVWYSGSFLIGVAFGFLPESLNLGFVAETEHQVMVHLDKHLKALPAKDLRSRAILQQMYKDEKHHATQAVQSGGKKLAFPIQLVMKAMSRVMTTVTYWI